MKPLDFVELIDYEVVEYVFNAGALEDGEKLSLEKYINTIPYSVGIITEVGEDSEGAKYSVRWIGGKINKCAWYRDDELVKIDSLPRILSNCIAHPFGGHTNQGDEYFGGIYE